MTKNNNSSNEHHDHSCGKQDCSSKQEPVVQLEPQTEDQVLTTFNVLNMDCVDEINALQNVLKIAGVVKFQANLMSSTVQILHKKEIPISILKERIESTVVRVVDETSQKNNLQNRNRILIVTAAGIFLASGLMSQWLGFANQISLISFFFSVILAGSLVFPKALGALMRKSLDMNVLMAVATIGAIVIKEYAEATAVVFLFSLSELLESLSVQRARRAIQELLKITPNEALLVNNDGQTTKIAAKDIKVGQIIRVLPGENFPLDGIVIKGSSSVNQAPLTGESLPIEKIKGETVFAGTINLESTLDIEVSKIFSETKIAQVIRLVEEAQSKRAVSQKFVDRFAQVYTPTVLAFAALTFLIPPVFFSGDWQFWLYKALVLLVIACPCALVLSTPVCIVSGLTALARKGVLVKGGVILENIGKIKALAIDKTGTITEGKPKVQKIVPFNSTSESEILQLAASLESHSTHPIAVAIVDTCKIKNIELKNISEFTNVTGRGIQAIIDGHEYMLGNHRFVHELGICTPELETFLTQIEKDSLSVAILAHKPHGDCLGKVLGVLTLGDQIRSDAKHALEKIRQAGVTKIIMISGDNQQTVTAVGKTVGLADAIGDLLPEGKVKYIESLQKEYESIAMVGDGINDAPAMAKSSIGIAMGAVGSDTAIETADIALMTDNLSMVATAIHTGRRTVSIIKFNIAFALLTKAIFIILTFMGISNLWLAVAADTGAALLVIVNSLRLLNVKD